MSDTGLMLTSVTSKGQVTIPKPVRSFLKIHEGKDYIGFRIHKHKIEIISVNVDPHSLKFSKAQWKKIEKLTSEKGRRFNTAKDAIQYLETI